MRKRDKRLNILQANLLAEHLHLNENELSSFEDNPQDLFNVYKSRVIEKLIELDSGQKVVDSVGGDRYDKFIQSNLNNGFTSEKTAMSIRDHWYGA